jgi:AsmA-like C-terminal region
MTRLLRIATAILLLFALLIGAAITALYVYQQQVISFVLGAIETRTGLAFESASSNLHFGSHLAVIFKDVQIVRGGKTISTLGSLRAIVGYHTILTSSGLPLVSITIENPHLFVPRRESGEPALALPRPEAAAVERMVDALQAMSRIARRAEVINAELAYRDGTVIFDHVGMLAFRHVTTGLWHFAFDGTIRLPPYDGAHIAGRIRANSHAPASSTEVAFGRLWMWGLPITNAEFGGFILTASVQGSASVSVHKDGSLTGQSDIGARDLQLGGPRLTQPIDLGDYSLEGSFDFSSTDYSISGLTVRRVGSPILSAATVVTGPYTDNPQIGVSLNGVQFELARIKQRLLEVRHLPREVMDWTKRVTSGALRLGEVQFNAPIEAIRTSPAIAIRQNLTVSATLQDAAFSLPPDLALPRVSELGVSINYSKGMVSIAQGSAKLGGTTIRDVSGSVDLRKGLQTAPYSLTAAADADLNELFPAIVVALKNQNVRHYQRLKHLAGVLNLKGRVKGSLSSKSLSPSDYQLSVAANGAVFTIEGAPGPVRFSRGAMVFTPGNIRIQRLVAAATGGDANLDGTIVYSAQGPVVRSLTLDFHQMPSESWLGLVIDPSDLGVRGPIGGRLVISGDPKHADSFSGNGKLTLAAGQVQFNFLRSPLFVSGATFELRGHELIARMPASKLEGSPTDWRITVPDILKPTVRLDVKLQRLDFEVMKFIRMPWSPATPPVKFPLPISGTIRASEANLGKFPMSDLSGDFNRAPSGDWRVYNFDAIAFKGRMNLDLKGRGPDNWVHIRGKVANMDPAPLFLMGGTRKESPIFGQLSLSEDLWANMDSDFFNTLAGDIDVTIRDGTLNKFTLLSRMLKLLDIKNYLTARFPDPREAGVPFKLIICDLKGKSGTFYTDNFQLQGPVMEMAASGSVNFADSTLDMQIGVFPFDTVDWVLNSIPLIGTRFGAGTGKLVAGYFDVHGPVSDPHITPKPLTTFAEFIKKTLGMPINIIRPNTIK